MAWYNTGTVSVTNNSATVTGSGTAFVANVDIGEGFLAPNGRIYEVTNVTSDTEITISPAYNGSTAGAQAYSIVPIQGRIADLTAEAKSLLSSFATVRDGIGSGLFPDGTVSIPALRFSADQDTGLFRPSANTLGLVTGGTQRVTVDESGNVGINTSSPSEILEVNGRARFNADILSLGNYRLNKAGGTLLYSTDGGDDIELRANNSSSSTTTELTLRVRGANDHIRMLTADVERMRIDNSGEVLIAGTSDRGDYKLQVNTTGVWAAGPYVNGSDRRIKRNVKPMADALDVVSSLKPVTFQHKPEYSDDRSVQPGFIAQDLQQALAGQDYLNGVVHEGPDHLNVAYQSLIPVLTKALQEANVKIDALESRLAKLEGN